MTERLRGQLTRALEAHLDGEPLRLPEGSSVLWNVFTSLSRTRILGPAGPNPIQPTEIECWMRLMRLPLEPRHVAILLEMDRIWMQHTYDRGRVPEGAKVLPPQSAHAITPVLFDLAVG
ncbi:phage tail assembly chaperone [Roseovarius indicus]|uniref:Uncharacterized protein n=1 Tax=Roseovarius indicus TaxID=540747 RepID=A0A0T5PFD9_9RHOB|nr:hypothetical protein [Roseovarius indicus]KRS19743.1 hypothetical protein XM52_02625 [Roseovarius indicus]QEW28902.1 hypothetical protein RIdsm_04743 [Roseovarius indicus]SFD82849.1 hypothetical protein SAMN04488031_102759 [Roseovarius indicus]